MTNRVLFRGEVIGVKVSRVAGELTKVTLECEDYNRLLSLIQIVPEVTGLVADDGTPYAISLAWGNGPEVFDRYWNERNGGPQCDVTTMVKAPAWERTDWSTQTGDLAGFLTEAAARQGGPIHFWVTWPDFWDGVWGHGLLFHWRYVNPTDPTSVVIGGTTTDTADQRYVMGWPASSITTSVVAAPAAIDYDTADWVTSVMPTTMDVSWDWASVRLYGYVFGGTPYPYGSGWVQNRRAYGGWSGQTTISAEGATSRADVEAIGTYHLESENSGFLRGAATIPAVNPVTGLPINGWRVGQVTTVSSLYSDRLGLPSVLNRPVAITSVRGRLVGPGTGLKVFIVNDDATDFAAHTSWSSFSVEEILGSPGKATITLELLDDVAPVALVGLGPAIDIWVTTDDTDPIEWELEFGDVPMGSLSQEFADKRPQVKGPAYKFLCEAKDPYIEVGQSTTITAQCVDASGAGFPVNDIQAEWLLFQFVERACERDESTGSPMASCATPGTGYVLSDPTSRTDANGLATITVTREAGSSTVWWVEAVAPPT